MKEINLTKKFSFNRTLENDSSDHKSLKFWTNALLFSSILGIVLESAGLFISGLSLFGLVQNRSGISRLGIWLIIGFFPLLILAAHCLDKIGKANKTLRIEHYKRLRMISADCR